jgi:hypothetical protein
MKKNIRYILQTKIDIKQKAKKYFAWNIIKTLEYKV